MYVFISGTGSCGFFYDIISNYLQELQLQDKMLNDLENKTDKTQAKLDATNERMKDALEKINDKASNLCIYIICIVLLLGIISVAFNFATKKK